MSRTSGQLGWLGQAPGGIAGFQITSWICGVRKTEALSSNLGSGWLALAVNGSIPTARLFRSSRVGSHERMHRAFDTSGVVGSGISWWAYPIAEPVTTQCFAAR